MEEEWMALALTVPETLLLVDASESEVLGFIRGASSALRLRRHDVVCFRSREIEVPDPLLQPVIPAVMLGKAFREMIAHHNELHNRAVRVFSLYGEHLGLLQATPLSQRHLVLLQGDRLWESWVQSRADAFDRTGEVLQRLRSAAAYDIAIMDAVFVAGMLPADSPSWSAWMLAAEQLAERAQEEASMALDEAYKMRNAVAMEYLDASMILNR